MPWIVWLLLAVLLGVGETLTLTLGFGLLAVAALAAAVVAGIGGGLVFQLLAFAVAGGIGLLVVRPIARRQKAMTPTLREGSDALVGRTATVVREVTAQAGLIKLAGEDWSARAYDQTHVIPVGARVEVLEIDGARAVVYPTDLLP